VVADAQRDRDAAGDIALVSLLPERDLAEVLDDMAALAKIAAVLIALSGHGSLEV
jgi:hypothetical protein